MGKYIPNQPKLKRSISETLVEAEGEHYLDCPNAEFVVRMAAFVLDAIFLFLIVTGTRRIIQIIAAAPFLGPNRSLPVESLVLLNTIEISALGITFYVLYIWTVQKFGGTAGKLLLGLKIIDIRTGKQLGVIQTVLREIVGKLILGPLTLGIGYLLPLVRGDALALHDLLSRSIVKKVRHKA